MIVYKLAVMSTPQNRLIINTGWNTQRCHEFFLALFPELFAHLARHPPAANAASEAVQSQTWLGVIKSKQSISLSMTAFPNGATLAAHAKKKGEAVLDRTLYLASKIEVPEERYMDWDVKTDSEGEDIEDDEDFDMLDGDDTPRKPSVNSQGKKPARPSPQKKTVTVKIEKLDLPKLKLSDMKTAATMRTRLASGTLVKKTVRVPNSSDDDQPIEVSDDDEDLPHPSKLVSSLARRTTPLFTLIDKSPSPVPAPEPSTESESFFDQFDFTSLPPSPAANSSGSGWASTSSLVSMSGAHNLPAFTSDIPSIPTGTSAAGSLPMAFTVPTSTAPSSAAGWTNTAASAGPSIVVDPPLRTIGFLKRAGKGKGLVNPWSKKV
ncbi:hypothetical protein B0H16DRAFT_1533081 [Mycena metata]|uniref:Uncharacterized protein n=1 Tax=Mycena metata TaxID=1033252 RepID=A0AAD7NGZ9_9AGAR|nr:hypothetical protein B0H16DRAFT_1533081 [Mycena metata]